MMGRGLWFLGLGAAFAVPYVAMDGNVPAWIAQQRSGMQGSADGLIDPALTSGEHPSTADAPTPLTPVPEILRWDVQPGWVMSRWPHVVTTAGNEQYTGLRIPIITGYESYDIAGSLTYYFDARQTLQRISLQGTTGDESPLAMYASQRFGLQTEPRLRGGLFVYRWNGEAISALSVDYAPIVSTLAPNQRRQVALELNRPGGAALSMEAREVLLGGAGITQRSPPPPLR